MRPNVVLPIYARFMKEAGGEFLALCCPHLLLCFFFVTVKGMADYLIVNGRKEYGHRTTWFGRHSLEHNA